MKNKSTSARNAAKYGYKCSLLFRQAPILAILMLAAVFLSSCGVIKDPKIGEVWRYSPNQTGNPFENNYIFLPYYDYKVMAVKNNYIQYLNIKDSSISSSLIRMFKVDAECLFNCR